MTRGKPRNMRGKTARKDFKRLSYKDKLEYIKNSHQATNEFRAHPEDFYNYLDKIDWHNVDFCKAIRRPKELKLLLDQNLLDQKAIDIIFLNTHFFPIFKNLIGLTSESDSVITKRMLDFLKREYESQEPKHKLFKKLDKEGVIDWDILNMHSYFQNYMNYVFGNYESYSDFANYLLDSDKIDLDGDTERSIWHTFDIDLMIKLLKKDRKIKTSANVLLDNGHIDEFFDKWPRDKVKEFIKLLNDRSELQNCIVENSYVSLLPEEITKIFVF